MQRTVNVFELLASTVFLTLRCATWCVVRASEATYRKSLFKANERFRKGAAVRGSVKRYASWQFASEWDIHRSLVERLLFSLPIRNLLRENRAKVDVPTQEESAKLLLLPIGVAALWIFNYFAFMR